MPLPADACNGPEEALQQALTLWEKRGRRRLGILAAAGLFEASLARGERRTVTTREESDQLVSDITRRGMAQPARQVKAGAGNFLTGPTRTAITNFKSPPSFY
jgi:hypothetical protein